jgi:hypothetical protein
MSSDPDGWADVSLEGVPAPDAPRGLTDVEALSPARRSPQVREAQRIGSRRPDLLPRQPSDR